MYKCLTCIDGSMQTLIITQIGKFMKNKNLFLHKAIEETTGLLLVTVQSAALLPVPSAFTFLNTIETKQYWQLELSSNSDNSIHVLSHV